MEDRALKKLSRSDLLEIMISVSKENEALQIENDKLKQALQQRKIALSEAGSIAKASLEINGVMEAAQKAADQYLFNVKAMAEDIRSQVRNEVINAQREADAIRARAIREAEDIRAGRPVQQAAPGGPSTGGPSTSSGTAAAGPGTATPQAKPAPQSREQQMQQARQQMMKAQAEQPKPADQKPKPAEQQPKPAEQPKLNPVQRQEPKPQPIVHDQRNPGTGPGASGLKTPITGAGQAQGPGNSVGVTGRPVQPGMFSQPVGGADKK